MKSTTFAAALTALSLAACGAPQVAGVPGVILNSADNMRAATGGERPVVIAGRPPDGAGPEAVAAVLRGPPRFATTTFRAIPLPADDPFTLVIQFGVGGPGPNTCVAPPGGRPAELFATATLCRGSRIINAATVRARNTAGPGDPEFDRLMRALLVETYRPRNRPPGRDSDSDD